MSMSKNLNFLVVSSLLLTFVSCGNKDDKSKSTPSVDAVCAEVDCLSSINWKILLQGRSFPEKSRVDVNGTTVLNECVSKQKYSINRSAEPQSLTLENFYVPKRGDVKISVVDLGSGCDSESYFISNDNVDFEVSKDNDVSEIVINL